MKQPDIVIFMSDQHSAEFSGWGSIPVDTPVLNRLREGVQVSHRRIQPAPCAYRQGWQ